MNPQTTDFGQTGRPPYFIASLALVGVGLVGFVGLTVFDPARAWQAYLVNFLLFSAIAQGALLFSAVMQVVGARWSGPLANLAEAFAAFFPVSVVLFVILLAGGDHVFPWRHAELHGKAVWLNLPFLFGRDLVGLLVLYGLGYVYVYHALRGKLGSTGAGALRTYLWARWRQEDADEARWRRRTTVVAVLYILAFALVLSLIGFDLVMAADPHWVSTLFGGYTFVKAFYTGLGALIVFAALCRLRWGRADVPTDAQFIDIGKLFLAFCLLWADFFYVHLNVIWYGNIPEETHYVILRTVLPPWNALAWTVFFTAFVIPFIVLINRRVKTRPLAMIALCSLAIVGIWLEHLLLLGPAISRGATALPLGLRDILISLGFLGLMVISVGLFVRTFPDTTVEAFMQKA
jgi:hypothetical protein